MTIQSLLKQTNIYLTPHDQEVIQKAYIFAEKIHHDQKRGTGEPYIIHPLAVASYLARDELDASTIVAALLHDVLEEDPNIQKRIKKEFGHEIADLVEGVTKLGKIKIKRSWFFPLNIFQDRQQKELGFQRHIESLRKMLLAISKDLRVVLIKFSDRLHNMQTLKGVRPDKRVRIALETLEIYAPLAYRLGMGELKGKLEDLAFPHAYPKEYHSLKKLIGGKYEEKEKYLNHVIAELKDDLLKHKIKVEINGRRKHFYSLWRKLQRYDNDFFKINDLVALRVIVNNIEDCYKVLGFIHAKWRPLIGRIKDYIAVPKPNGYQSLHTTVFGPEGQIVEVQIRTQEMHDRAEHGIASHWHYSDKKDQRDKSYRMGKNQLEWLDELEHWQANIADAKEFSQMLKMDFFHDRIFIFTPQGDVYDLPQNATPVDFAFAIHSEIGETCAGARVRGKLEKLNYPLSNGDIVEIITKKGTKPKRDWLHFVKTSKARGRIRAYFENKKTS